MKCCPNCARVYPEDAGFCPVDGAALTRASSTPVKATDDPRLGARLCGRYELRRVVADGGMGRVYEGIDHQIPARVAVKILHDDVAKDEVSLARFRREYEISKQLPHDHIVDVHDFQFDADRKVWLLVMEFLDGAELREVLKRNKTLHPARIVRMLAHTALGLDAAHARQFVHRDLKPDNLFLCGHRDGDLVKILDFGSVKDKNKDAKKLTQLGTTIGSPFYMAPEQAQGLESLDARADVFAMSAITYEAVTGTVPFQGSNGPSILLAILTKDPVPPSEQGRGTAFPPPAALDDVIEVGLAKNANIRFKSVGDLADAVGKAYGLQGTHKDWAVTPQKGLEEQMAAVIPRSSTVSALETTVDPFAAPSPGASSGHGRASEAAAAGARPEAGGVAIPSDVRSSGGGSSGRGAGVAGVALAHASAASAQVGGPQGGLPANQPKPLSPSELSDEAVLGLPPGSDLASKSRVAASGRMGQTGSMDAAGRGHGAAARGGERDRVDPDESIAGIPDGRPPWVIPAAVVAVLLLGAVLVKALAD